MAGGAGSGAGGAAGGSPANGRRARGPRAGVGEESSVGAGEAGSIGRPYGVRGGELDEYRTRAAARSGDAATNLRRLLELRLDNVVHLLGLSETRGQARQFVMHGHFLVNGHNVE